MTKIVSANQRVPVKLKINGQPRTVQVEPPMLLAQVIREQLGLMGTKVACGMANCGACTVIRDGMPIYSCITLALDCEGSEITTIEGLAESWTQGHAGTGAGAGASLHPVQRAFVDQDAYQCGFCTSGQILSLAAFLAAHAEPTESEIRQAMAGNLCRCGAYLKIVKAGMQAAKEMTAAASR